MNTVFLKPDGRHFYVTIVALLQSVALLGLHHWVQGLPRLEANWVWILPLYTFVLIFPLSVMLLAHVSRWRSFVLTSIFSLVLILCAVHVAQTSDVPNLLYDRYRTSFLFGFSAFFAWFVAVVFIEHFCVYAQWYSHYVALHDFAWRNLVKLVTACIFVGLFWAALALLAGLFAILKIDFFKDLIANRYFAYPATTLMFGLGLSLYAAKQESLTEFKRSILQVLGWLLPMVSLIVVGFAAALGITGLSLLWSTGYATTLMLCLMMLMIFLMNAIFQEGNAPQYPSWLLKLSNVGLMVLPLYSVLSMYALYLRVDQYGWTVDRVWAAVSVAWIAIYAWGYAFSAYQSLKSVVWMQSAKAVNVAAALLLITLLTLIHSPVLNPMRVSVQSQVERLLTKKVAVKDFDFEYLRFYGGKYGDTALQSLLTNHTHQEATEIKKSVTAVLKQAHPTNRLFGNDKNPRSIETFKKAFHVYPSEQVLEDDLMKEVYEKYTQEHRYHLCFEATIANNDTHCTVLMIDLNQDQVLEAVVIENEDYQPPELYIRSKNGWAYQGLMILLNDQQPNENAISATISQNDYKTMPPAWQMLQIGKRQYMPADCCADTNKKP